ncbi:MAG: 6-phosphogluconolactonase [Candidatus Wildermuthbacteria bacterium]|nr:6-phosphogluconolactonase [Candidatus Wildermuthbacteria bacterium]
MEIVRCKSKEEAKKSAGKKLNQLFLSHQHLPVLFLSSGGSALQLLDEIDTTCLPKNLTVGVLDERMDVEPKNSNRAQFKISPFFMKLQERNVPFHDLLSDEYSFFLSTEKYPDGKVIITQGVGADGHTAGIVPFPEDPKMFRQLFENEDRSAVVYEAEEKNEYPHRATATISFLRQEVDHSVVYMVGEEKREALERILADEGTLYETPARIVREMQNVTIFTDIL